MFLRLLDERWSFARWRCSYGEDWLVRHEGTDSHRGMIRWKKRCGSKVMMARQTYTKTLLRAQRLSHTSNAVDDVSALVYCARSFSFLFGSFLTCSMAGTWRDKGMKLKLERVEICWGVVGVCGAALLMASVSRAGLRRFHRCRGARCRASLSDTRLSAATTSVKAGLKTTVDTMRLRRSGVQVGEMGAVGRVSVCRRQKWRLRIGKCEGDGATRAEAPRIPRKRHESSRRLCPCRGGAIQSCMVSLPQSARCRCCCCCSCSCSRRMASKCAMFGWSRTSRGEDVCGGVDVHPAAQWKRRDPCCSEKHPSLGWLPA